MNFSAPRLLAIASVRYSFRWSHPPCQGAGGGPDFPVLQCNIPRLVTQLIRAGEIAPLQGGMRLYFLLSLPSHCPHASHLSLVHFPPYSPSTLH